MGVFYRRLMNSHVYITARSYIPRYRLDYQVGGRMGVRVAAALAAVGVVTAREAVVKRLARVIRYTRPAGGGGAAVPEKYQVRCLSVGRLCFIKGKSGQQGNDKR